MRITPTRRTIPLPIRSLLFILGFACVRAAAAGIDHHLDVPGGRWSLAGPYVPDQSAITRYGSGSTTWTLEPGLYVFRSEGATLWRGSQLLAENLLNDDYLLQVARTQSRVYPRNPEWWLDGYVWSAFPGPCGSLAFGTKGFPYLPVGYGNGLLPGLTYWFEFETWNFPVTPTPTATPTPAPTSTPASAAYEPSPSTGNSKALASNLTNVHVEYRTPTDVQTWDAFGGEFYGFPSHEYVEVPGPPLEPLDLPDVGGWMFF